MFSSQQSYIFRLILNVDHQSAAAANSLTALIALSHLLNI
jgi:hypothetical protein